MTKTARIAELMRIYETRGFWTRAEAKEAREIIDMGREAGYMPEGTEGWMEEDGVPRAYDKPRKGSPDVPEELRALAERTRDAVDRTADVEELRGKHVRYDAATGELTPVPAEDARIRTLEATVTDMMRRLKALEERVIDPSV
jgi:hypothetical protein